MIQEMLKQTRNALIYSDLALFVMDAREGITFSDVQLYNWLTMQQLKLDDEFQKENKIKKERDRRIREGGLTMDDFESPVILEPQTETERITKYA